MYKYSCRKCPIRNRCIDESSNADSIKVMIRRAFEARTDTLATWGRLQKNCLLLKAEEEKKSKTSPLTLRLQQVRATRDGVKEDAEPEGAVVTPEAVAPETTKQPTLPRVKPIKKQPDSLPVPDYLKPVNPEKKPSHRTLKRLSDTRPVITGPELFWLTIDDTSRHITLPTDGSFVFGRFDPNVGIPPDIDLSFEDQKYRLISRRHASVFGQNGKHTIEDLGSNTGIFLNGTKIDFGPSRPLETGDVVKLGNIKLVYSKIPDAYLKKARTDQVRHILRITPTGRKIMIEPSKRLVIGRADERIDFIPDVDLRVDGDITRLVSRRHALIQWRYGQPYVEDLGSGFGTRLRGELLSLGQAAPLSPGDHVWLAGCVLAYDIEL